MKTSSLHFHRIYLWNPKWLSLFHGSFVIIHALTICFIMATLRIKTPSFHDNLFIRQEIFRAIIVGIIWILGILARNIYQSITNDARQREERYKFVMMFFTILYASVSVAGKKISIVPRASAPSVAETRHQKNVLRLLCGEYGVF